MLISGTEPSAVILSQTKLFYILDKKEKETILTFHL